MISITYRTNVIGFLNTVKSAFTRSYRFKDHAMTLCDSNTVIK